MKTVMTLLAVVAVMVVVVVDWKCAYVCLHDHSECAHAHDWMMVMMMSSALSCGGRGFECCCWVVFSNFNIVYFWLW